LGYFPLQLTQAGCQDGDVLAMLAALAGWPTMSMASAWSVLAGQRFFGRLNSNISRQSWLSADAQRQRARAAISGEVLNPDIPLTPNQHMYTDKRISPRLTV
jgi:hypothetical protein